MLYGLSLQVDCFPVISLRIRRTSSKANSCSYRDLLLRIANGISLSDSAGILGLTESAVLNRRSRAYAKIGISNTGAGKNLNQGPTVALRTLRQLLLPDAVKLDALATTVNVLLILWLNEMCESLKARNQGWMLQWPWNLCTAANKGIFTAISTEIVLRRRRMRGIISARGAEDADIYP